MTDHQYTFTRSEGLVHIHAPSRPKECIGCVRQDAFEIIAFEVRRQVLAEIRAAVARSSGGGR